MQMGAYLDQVTGPTAGVQNRVRDQLAGDQSGVFADRVDARRLIERLADEKRRLRIARHLQSDEF